MGSWHGTCGLTQLPIENGDKIVLFPIKKVKGRDREASGYCYQNQLYAPISLPLHGEYDDYGGIKNITRNGDLVFDHLMPFLFNANYNEILDAELSRNRLNENPSGIEELINNYIGRNVFKDVGFMMVLENVYTNVLLKSFQENHYTDMQQSMNQFITDIDFAHFEPAKAKKRIEELVVLLDNKTMSDQELNEYQLLKCVVSNFLNMSDFPQYDFLQTFSFYRGYYRVFSKFALQMAKTKDHDLKQNLLDFLMFEYVLESTRKSWLPQSGKGSSEAENSYYKIIANTTLATIDKRRLYLLHECDAHYWIEELQQLPTLSTDLILGELKVIDEYSKVWVDSNFYVRIQMESHDWDIGYEYQAEFESL